MKKERKIKEGVAITDYKSEQKYYVLPIDCYCPVYKVEVWNEKKKLWEERIFKICLYLFGRKLKTDKQIRIYYIKQK